MSPLRHPRKKMRRILAGIYIGTVLAGVGILVTGLVTVRNLLLLMGNSILLIGTAVRSTIDRQGCEDEAVAQFQRGFHLLVPRLSTCDSKTDPLTSRSWTHRLRGLGLLYWIDRGAILALICLVIWLVWLAVHDVAHAPAFAILLTALLWGLRIALRILWSVRQIRHAGKGSITRWGWQHTA